MVTPTRTIGVKVGRANTERLQILASRAIRRNRARRRNMVSGNGVAHFHQTTCGIDCPHFIRFGRHGFKKWRMLDIGRLRPVINGRVTGVQISPNTAAREHISIFGLKYLSGHVLSNIIRNFFAARPQVFQIHRVTVFILTQRRLGDIDFHVASQRIGNHQWRRRQVVSSDFRVYTAFKIAVTRQHRGNRELRALNGFFNGFRQWTRITDTGCTAVSNQVESKRFQMRH